MLIFLMLPFIFLPLGYISSCYIRDSRINKLFEVAFNGAFYTLLFVMGARLVVDNKVWESLAEICLMSLLLVLFAVGGSMGFTWLIYRNKEQYAPDATSKNGPSLTAKEIKYVGLVVGIIVIGGIASWLWLRVFSKYFDTAINVSLVFLYLGAGYVVGTHRHAIKLKEMITQLIILPFIIYVGSIVGGILFAFIFKRSYLEAALVASGMGYYSVTSAFCFNTLGPVAGSIAFLVNVLREVFTITLAPLLAKICPYFTLAAGGATTMDMSLGVILKVQGPQIGMIALYSGIVLTFLVPLGLPVLMRIF